MWIACRTPIHPVCPHMPAAQQQRSERGRTPLEPGPRSGLKARPKVGRYIRADILAVHGIRSAGTFSQGRCSSLTSMKKPAFGDNTARPTRTRPGSAFRRSDSRWTSSKATEKRSLVRARSIRHIAAAHRGQGCRHVQRSRTSRSAHAIAEESEMRRKWFCVDPRHARSNRPGMSSEPNGYVIVSPTAAKTGPALWTSGMWKPAPPRGRRRVRVQYPSSPCGLFAGLPLDIGFGLHQLAAV